MSTNIWTAAGQIGTKSMDEDEEMKGKCKLIELGKNYFIKKGGVWGKTWQLQMQA